MLSLPTILFPWLLNALFVGGGAEVTWCHCTPLSAPEAYERATLVFTGRAISGEVPTEDEMLNSIGNVRYRLAMDEVFKGTVPDTVEVWGGRGIWCLHDFIIGERYVVFAFRTGTFLGDRDLVPMERCTPTARLSQAEETLDFLRTRHP